MYSTVPRRCAPAEPNIPVRMISPTIRKAETRDILEIQRLYRQLDGHHADLLPEVFQPVDGNARENNFVQKWIARDTADYLLAELDGRVVGFVTVEQAAHPKHSMFCPHEFALIDNAVVDQPYRGQGGGERPYFTPRLTRQETTVSGMFKQAYGIKMLEPESFTSLRAFAQ